jgi:hypothetical protein
MVATRLVDLGRQVFVAVAAGVSQGEPLVKCQLRASQFYEALKRELRQTLPMDDAERATLIAAANQCERVAVAGICPGAMLTELENALSVLEAPQPAPPRRSRPVLRVIEGGLSSKSPGAIVSSSAVRLGRDAP